MTGNLSDCVPAVFNGKLNWYTWKRNVIVFYEISLSDFSSTKAVKIVNGHKYSYGKDVTNGTVAINCSACGESLGNAAVPVSLNPIYNSQGGSYRYMKGKVFLDQGKTYQLNCNPVFTASGNNLYECEVESSDPSVVSVNMTGKTEADITVHKSGTATLTMRSRYNPEAVLTADISVGILDSSQYTLRLADYNFTYDGTEHIPTAELDKNGQTVDEKNYSVSYEGDLVNVGTVKVIATGKGELSGTITRQFKITPADFSKCEVNMSEAPVYFYKDKECVPEFTVKDGDKVLTEGKDFTVTYNNNTRPGTAQAIFRGTGNYNSSPIFKTFNIIEAPDDKDDDGNKGDSENKDNTGNKGDIDNKDDTDNKGDTDDKDNTESKGDTEDKNNTDNKEDSDGKENIGNKEDSENKGDTDNKGGIGNKGDTGNTETPSEPEDDKPVHNLSECEITVNAENFVYDGTAKEAKVTVTYKGKVLVEGQDYKLTYDRNKNAGRAAVIIHGKDMYTGSVYKTFQIARADAAVKTSSKSVTMSSKKQNITDLVITDGKITCKSSDSQTVKISGTKFIALKPGKVTLTISAKQGQNYNALAKTTISEASQHRRFHTEITHQRSGRSDLESCKIHQWLSDPV